MCLHVCTRRASPTQTRTRREAGTTKWTLKATRSGPRCIRPERALAFRLHAPLPAKNHRQHSNSSSRGLHRPSPTYLILQYVWAAPDLYPHAYSQVKSRQYSPTVGAPRVPPAFYVRWDALTAMCEKVISGVLDERERRLENGAAVCLECLAN